MYSVVGMKYCKRSFSTVRVSSFSRRRRVENAAPRPLLPNILAQMLASTPRSSFSVRLKPVFSEIGFALGISTVSPASSASTRC